MAALNFNLQRGVLFALVAGLKVAQAHLAADSVVSSSVSTATVVACATEYDTSCICPVPTSTSTVSIPKSVTITRILAESAAAITPMAAAAEAVTTTVTVSISTGIVPMDDRFIPLRPETLEEETPETCLEQGDNCDDVDYHVISVGCTKTVQEFDIHFIAAPESPPAESDDEAPTPPSVTEVVYEVPMELWYERDIVWEACSRTTNVLTNWGDYTFNEGINEDEAIGAFNAAISLRENVYQCCVVCYTMPECTNAHLDWDGSSNCRVVLNMGTCPNPQVTIGKVPVSKGSDGGYLMNGHCGGLEKV